MSTPNQQNPYLQLPNPRPSNQVPIWLIGVLCVFGGFFVLCCGCPMMIAVVTPNRITTADNKWRTGQKDEAVSLYMTEVNGSMPSNSPHIYERIIEFQIDRNNLELSEKYSDLAVERNIELSPQSSNVAAAFTEAKNRAAKRIEQKKADAEAKKKAEDEEKKMATARENARLQKHADNFMFLLAARSPGADKIILKASVSEVANNVELATITVQNHWHVQPYQIRLQMTQNLWNIWVKAADKSENPDDAMMDVVDINGNKVGGTGLTGIWVQEK